MAETRRALVSARQQTIEAVKSLGAGWDPEAFHVMERRDEELIADEILNGAGSSKFVYSFDINGTAVNGISVIGARHLAAHYGGLKHRLVASAQKTGEMFVFTSFPAENISMQVSCSVVPELADQPDYYSVVVEIADIKSGNSIQIERRESRWDSRRDGSLYERPNYQTIAQSKAYRNGVLDLIPQDILIRWRTQMLKLGKEEIITDSVISEKRAGVLRFATARAIPLSREAIEELTMNQIAGLSDAAREGSVPAFAAAARSLGLEIAEGENAQQVRPSETESTQPQTARHPAGRTDDERRSQMPDAGKAPSGEAQAAPTGERRVPRRDTAAPAKTDTALFNE